MKICVIAPVVLPLLGNQQKYGGIELVISSVTSELIKKGHDVIVYASGDSQIKARVVPITPKALGIGASFEKEKECNRKAYEMSIKEKPDVIWDNTLAIHAYDEKPPVRISPYLAQIFFTMGDLIDTGQIPVVQTLHSQAKGFSPNIAHQLSNAGHYFVTISRDQAIGYLNHIKIMQHMGTVYNPVDIDFFKPAVKKTNDFLLWVGRLGMEKGAHIALAAAHKAHLPAVLIGKMIEKHEIDYFEKFIKSELLPGDEFINQGEPSLNAEMFRNAKAFLMTNLWKEPFGMVVAESMASGTPVIGPAMGSLTELIDTSGVLIDVDDLDLSENVTEITESQIEYIDRVAKAVSLVDSIPANVPRKRAEFLFSPTQCANGYEEAFLKAIYLNKIENTI